MSAGMVPFVRFFPEQGTARLESHYYQGKRVTAAPSHSTHQMPARYAKANKTKPQRQSGPRKKRK